MGGVKTWLAALISIISGVGMLLTVGLAMMSGESVPDGASFTAGIALVTGGLGMIGIGHKIEKAGDKIAGAEPPS